MDKEQQELMQMSLNGYGTIYEKLAHNEVYLIEKAGNSIFYAVNRLGTVELKRADFKE